MDHFRPFPIPVVATGWHLGPGSQPERELPTIVPIPSDITAFQPPVRPERESLAGHADTIDGGAIPAAIPEAACEAVARTPAPRASRAVAPATARADHFIVIDPGRRSVLLNP